MIAVAACSPGEPERSPESNVTVAPASVPTPVPATSSAVDDQPHGSAATASPTPLPTLPPGDVSGAMPDGPAQSAAGAAQVVRRYYALLARGEVAEARGLWRDKGRASNQSPEAFARDHAGDRTLEAEVGEPGRIEPGAGQRYIQVPVTLRDGAQRRGTVTLRRAGPVDGASAEDRSWRISTIDMEPAA